MTPPAHARFADAGLQNERTSLAWFRTSLSFAGVGALLLRSSAGLARPVPAVLGSLALAVSGATLLISTARYSSVDAQIRRQRPAPPPKWLLLATALTAVTLPVALLVAQLRAP